MIAVARTLVTKWLLSGEREFSYPVFYSAVSCIATVAAIIVICILGGFDLHMLQKRHMVSFTWIAALTALDMGATNIAVESISVALQQTIKASLPVMVVLLEMTTMVSQGMHGWADVVPWVCYAHSPHPTSARPFCDYRCCLRALSRPHPSTHRHVTHPRASGTVSTSTCRSSR